MKIWKLAVTAALLLASAAFGAPSLQLSTSSAGAANWVTTAPLTSATGPLTLNVNLNGDGQPVLNCSFAIMSSQSGAIRLTGRTLTSPELSEVQTSDAVALATANSLLNPKNGKDLGLVSADGVATVPGKETICTLTFSIEPGQTLQYPVTLSIVGPGVLPAATWGDPDFNSTNLAATTFTITPEPASMLLLAAGAAFFARRRRA